MSDNPYFVGLDLGQASDYSALCILERQGPPRPDAVFHCRHLQRWSLKTPYPQIVSDVSAIMRRDALQGPRQAFDAQRRHHGYQHEIERARTESLPVLVIDGTGVGAAVVDLFKEEFQGSWMKRAARLLPVLITGGDKVTVEGGYTRVPKRDLIGAAQVALQNEQLKIAPTLPEAATLVKELQNYQVKIDINTAHDSYGAWREGTHDDVLLSVCLALWAGRWQVGGFRVNARSYSYRTFADRVSDAMRGRRY